MNPYLISSEYSSTLPVLIIDKQGVIGLPLAQKLSLEFLTIFVHGDAAHSGNNIIYTPYKKSLSVIPDNLFSYIFIISDSERELFSQVKAFSAKAREAETQLVVIIPATLARQRTIKMLQRLAPQVTIIIHGDLFGVTANGQHSVLDGFLSSALLESKLHISTSGSETSYPIYVEDVVSGIIRATFAEYHAKEIFLLLPEYPLSDVSLVRMLQKELPETIVLRSRKKRKQMSYFIPSQGIHVYNQYDVEKGIKAAIHHFPQNDFLHSSPTYIPTRLAVMQQRVKTIFSLLGLTLVALVLVVLLGYVGVKSLQVLSPKHTFSHSPLLASTTQTGILLSQQALADASPLLSLLGLEKAYYRWDEHLQTSYEQLRLAYLAQNVSTRLARFSTSHSSEEPQALPAQFKQVYVAYESLLAQQHAATLSQLGSYQPLFAQVLPFIDLLPELLGSQGAKTYLVLLLNNAELRAGGGVIGSYALVTIDKGHVQPVSVHSVSELDGQQTEASAPPAYLRQYAGLTQLSLRDSAYAVDTSEALKEANLLFYLESKTRVDGIITLDTSLISSLLQFTGSVELANYPQAIGDDNFAQLAGPYLANTPLPNVSQKRDFFVNLQQALSKKLQQQISKNPQEFSSLLSNQLAQRHVLMYSEDPSLENLILVANLSATIAERRPAYQATFADFTSLNEANVGLNSANLFIKRNLEQKITLGEDGSEEGLLSIDYTNAVTADIPGGGEYKAYVQLVLPEKAKLSEIFVDGDVQNLTTQIKVAATRKGVKKTTTLQVDKTLLDNRVSYGFFITVPTGARKNVSITYQIPQVVSVVDKYFTYEYLWAKQPGTLSDPLHVAIDYPANFSPVSYSPQIHIQDNQAVFDSDVTTDQSVSLTFKTQ